MPGSSPLVFYRHLTVALPGAARVSTNVLIRFQTILGWLRGCAIMPGPAPTSTPAAHMKYRPDIDGLRSLAILPVVLNHLGVRGFWGGYVGVDIFFVISGFLITGNIAAEARSGTYTIRDFYKKRIIRIFPALFAMFAVCTVLAWFVMLPTELVRYARSLVTATFFGSNMLFYAEAGYFEQVARLKPLLHTWSLAIEEQFYILWPLVVAPIALRWPRRLPGLTLALALVSLGLSVWLVNHDPSGAYYLLPSRAWELCIGALVATLPPFRLKPWLNQTLATLALIAIAFAIHRFNEASAFPGLLALLPCLGAGVLILTGTGESWAARLLSWRPLVVIGENSYSLYLWHWPVIVFGSIGLFLPPTATVIVAELAIAFALAFLSTAWIEKPFRTRARSWSAGRVLACGSGAMVLAALVSAALIAAKGVPGRFTPAQQAVAAYEGMDGDALYRRGTCFVVGSHMGFAASSCLAHDRTLPSLLLLGDSHAAHYWPGLARYRNRFDVLQATKAGCKPLLYPDIEDPCVQFMRKMLTEWLPAHRPDELLLGARWRAEDLPLLAQTLADPGVQAAHPVLIGPVPQYTSGLPRLLVFGAIRSNPDLAYRALDPDLVKVDRDLATLAARMHVRYVSMLGLMCNGHSCLVLARPGIPMQFDYGHFTREGSIRATDLLMNAIGQIRPQ